MLELGILAQVSLLAVTITPTYFACFKSKPPASKFPFKLLTTASAIEVSSSKLETVNSPYIDNPSPSIKSFENSIGSKPLTDEGILDNVLKISIGSTIALLATP